MKIIRKFVRWLAEITGTEITVEKTVEVEKIVEKTVYLPPEGGTLSGDVCVDGDLTVSGSIRATGTVTCKELKEEDVQNG